MNTAPNYVVPERFETERFVLRRPNSGDAKAIYAYASDPEV